MKYRFLYVKKQHLINGRVYGNSTFNYKLYVNNYLKMSWKMRGRNLACPIFRLGPSIFHEGPRKPTKDFNTGQQRFESCTPRIRHSRTNWLSMPFGLDILMDPTESWHYDFKIWGSNFCFCFQWSVKILWQCFYIMFSALTGFFKIN